MKIKRIFKLIGMLTLITIVCSGCSKNNNVNDIVEYKVNNISVDSNTMPYRVAKFNKEEAEEKEKAQSELNSESEVYKDKLEQYSNIENDLVKNQITEIILEDTVGNVDWAVNEQGDVIYNSIVFTDLYTNASMINSKYNSREIIDFIVHNFNIIGDSNVVFSRLTDNDIISAEINEDVHSTFLDRFYEIDSYKDFISKGNSDITWTLCIYEYGYTHLAEIHGNENYIISFSSKNQDTITYNVQAKEIVEEPVIESEEPVIESEEQVIESEEPVIESEEQVIESEETLQ